MQYSAGFASQGGAASSGGTYPTDFARPQSAVNAHTDARTSQARDLAHGAPLPQHLNNQSLQFRSNRQNQLQYAIN